MVNNSNLEKYVEALNPTQQYMVRNGVEMPVIEYRKYDWQPGLQGSDGKVLEPGRAHPGRPQLMNYIAGAPFPTIDENDPQAGAKWM